MDAQSLQKEVLDGINKTASDKCIPLHVLMELSYNCNLKCVHCYTVRKQKKELSTEEIKDIIDQLAKEKTLFLTFSGGEPLLRDDFFEIANYAKKRKFAISIKTNATLITPEIADRIKQINPYRVQISLYGPNRETYKAVTGDAEAYEKTINAIKLLKKRGIGLWLTCPLLKQTSEDMNRIEDFAEKSKIPFALNYRIFPKDNGSKEPLKHAATKKILKEMMTKVLNARKFEVISPGDKKKFDRSICKAGVYSAFINPYGGVFSCGMLAFGRDNLRKKSFHDIWKNSKALNSIRHLKIKDTECNGCNLIDYCYKCPGLGYLEKGNIKKASRIVCNEAKIKYQILKALKGDKK